jgi:hypothetical protein
MPDFQTVVDYGDSNPETADILVPSTNNPRIFTCRAAALPRIFQVPLLGEQRIGDNGDRTTPG